MLSVQNEIINRQRITSTRYYEIIQPKKDFYRMRIRCTVHSAIFILWCNHHQTFLHAHTRTHMVTYIVEMEGNVRRRQARYKWSLRTTPTQLSDLRLEVEHPILVHVFVFATVNRCQCGSPTITSRCVKMLRVFFSTSQSD